MPDKNEMNGGTVEALRIGLQTLRTQRDQLDAQIREVERFLKSPTRTAPPAVTQKAKWATTKKSHGTLSTKNVREALYGDNNRKLYVRGQVVEALLRNGSPISMAGLSSQLNRNGNMISYAIRTAPRGLFQTERQGNRVVVSLSNTGAELSRQALARRIDPVLPRIEQTA